MVGKIQKRLTLLLAGICAVLSASAQSPERADSLVRLMKASSLEQFVKYGRSYRKTIDATFLHNGTYLICDSALWDIDSKVINAEGNVKLIQDETELTSDKLDYLVDQDLAQFRGTLVQMQDKQHNTLRTRYLDYNTKDSIAVFTNGGAFRDKDGQIIESREGTYDTKRKLITFRDNVNMFTDSVFVKTTLLDFSTATSTAVFKAPIDFWKEDNMLSALSGWYDRRSETFFFDGNVHGTSKTQEVWCDTMYFYRLTNDIRMYSSAQIQDTTRNVAAVADYVYYQDSLSKVTMQLNAAVALRTEQDAKVDTLYFGADTLVYQTVRMCDISEDETSAAKSRLEDILTDPVTEYRQKAAKEAAEAAAKAAEEDPNTPPSKKKGGLKPGAPAAMEKEKKTPGKAPDAASKAAAAPDAGEKAPSAPAPPAAAPPPAAAADSLRARPDSLALPALSDSLRARPDSLALPALSDSLRVRPDSLALPSLADSLSVMPDSLALAAQADSLANAAPLDTTKVGFLLGVGRVKIFRQDIQVLCDSLRYCELDSIARFYINPIVWNDGNRQYTSDSLSVLIRDSRPDRASLMSNAFVITQEQRDTSCFDQIKSVEMLAYFDTSSSLKRYDALGGANALFYLEENESLATVNKVESKMLSVWFVNGEMDKVYYFDSPKNDAYPVVQLPKSDRVMKGFDWQPGKRPKGKSDITPLTIKKSERSSYEARPKTEFKQTDIYFPGYMKGVYRDLARQQALRRIRADRQAQADSSALQPRDSLAVSDSLMTLPDSLSGGLASLPDSLAAVRDSLAASADSLGLITSADSLAAGRDSLAAADSLARGAEALLTPAERKALEKERKARERAERKTAKEAEREAKWAELDARDAAKEEARRQKQLAKERLRKRKELKAQLEQERRDSLKFEEYKAYYEARKAREDASARSDQPVAQPIDQPIQQQPDGE